MKRYLKITQESAFGTVPEADPISIWLRIPDANAFRPMTEPEYWRIMSGSGFAVPALTGTQTARVAGTLTTPLTAEQASFLLSWAGQRIAADNVPWQTSELVGDLPSCTCEFGWSNFDGTLRKKGWGGVKVARWRLSGSRSSTVMMLSLDLIGGSPKASTLAEPADSVFPVQVYTFQHLRGGFTLGSARTNFETINVDVQNALTPYFDESQYANAVRMGGRSSSVTSRIRLKASPDDRALWEAGTEQALSLVWTGYSHSATLNFNAKNWITGHAEDIPIDRESYVDLAIQNYLDTSAAADLTMSFT